MEIKMTKNTVFETLNTIKINKKDIEKKGQFNYISWATAWDHVSRAYPDVTFTKKLSDIDGFVSVSITIEGRTLTEEFPILDYKNKPIPQPNAFQINTAFQRGLVKCLGMFGYGLFIYKGEDLPPDNVPRETIQEQPKEDYVDEDNHADNMEKEGYEVVINSIDNIDDLVSWGKDNADKINKSNHTEYIRGIFISRKTALEDRV
jgi:hypothetical protein